MVFAPDMDLSLYDPNFLWVVTGDLGCIPNVTGPYPGTATKGCNTNGAEEFGIMGGLAPSTTQVPTPGALALLGLGLGILGWRVRRKAS